jgi:hypothetical protein
MQGVYVQAYVILAKPPVAVSEGYGCAYRVILVDHLSLNRATEAGGLAYNAATADGWTGRILACCRFCHCIALCERLEVDGEQLISTAC